MKVESSREKAVRAVTSIPGGNQPRSRSFLGKWFGMANRGGRFQFQFELGELRFGKAWTSGLIAALPFLFAVYYVFGTSLRHGVQISSFGGDEHLLYYLAGRNFVTYGFSNSDFLQDISSSSRAEDHPFVYNHMPPGPELLVAAMMKLVGERYRTFRIVFAGAFLAGVGCFLWFVSILFRTWGRAGAGFALLFIPPATMLRLMDHPMYFAFPLLAFFPLVAMDRYYASRKARWLLAGFGVALVSSFFLAYQFVILTGLCWILLSALRLFRLDRRHVLGLCSVTALGVGIHLAQNVVHLGMSQALADVRLTVANRATGRPTGEELKDWYQSINIVHHGTHELSGIRLVESIGRTLASIYGIKLTLGALILSVFLRWWRRSRLGSADSKSDPPIVRLAIWVGLTLTIPLAVFPAYSADYNLQGVGAFYLSPLAVLVLGGAFREIGDAFRRLRGKMRLTASAAAGVLVAGIASLLMHDARAIRRSMQAVRNNPYAELAELPKVVGGRVVMTNIYPGAVGFFTKEAVIGGAEFEAFPENGPPNPDAAYARHIRNYGQSGRRPQYYVLFRRLYTGFTKYRDEESVGRLHAHIAKRHKMVYENHLFTVFELHY